MIDLRLGDCLDVMKTLEHDSVDAIVTDPPYGLGFMGKDWDHGVPGVAFWVEALRVAKPGAMLLAFGGTRTFHRLAVAIEDAGWELRDSIGYTHDSGDAGDCPWLLAWVYGSGFPKSHDVSKAIDREAGAAREVVGFDINKAAKQTSAIGASSYGDFSGNSGHITEPATDGAQQWDGWGTALKPAWEPIVVARKPLIGTVAHNVLQYGTGGINVDACRVEYLDEDDRSSATPQGRVTSKEVAAIGAEPDAGRGLARVEFDRPELKGRWPANVIHDGSDEVVGLFPVTTSGKPSGTRNATKTGGGFSDGYGDIPVTGFGDTGSAARFFYCAKASKADRDEGLDGFPERQMARNQSSLDGGKMLTGAGNPRSNYKSNHHPTVKPTDLMRYLCKLVTQPGGIILDPFMGSGSTGKAAALEGFGFIGIDKEPEYIEIARGRIEAARKKTDLDALPLFQTDNR